MLSWGRENVRLQQQGIWSHLFISIITSWQVDVLLWQEHRDRTVCLYQWCLVGWACFRSPVCWHRNVCSLVALPLLFAFLWTQIQLSEIGKSVSVIVSFLFWFGAFKKKRTINQPEISHLMSLALISDWQVILFIFFIINSHYFNFLSCWKPDRC